ncbi:MAG: hypothetical protein HQ579_00790 [Candidatus Omnitrophica bacterium]|nr:hypothetical protein [Candidatus Omnitrophota bacterium]
MRLFIIVMIFYAFLIPSIFAEPIPENQAEKLATAMGIVYVGMPKEALYEIYTPLTQKGYRKIDDEEWIAFSDWTTEESGDLVTFYLKEGKVKGWKANPSEKPVPTTTSITL